MESSTTPVNATGIYSVELPSTLPSGVSLDVNTGDITVSDFSLLTIGVNTFTVTFTGNGSFEGTPTFDVTITKRELATLDDIANTVYDWPLSEDGTIIETDGVISQVNGRYDASGFNLTNSGSNNRRPFVSSMNDVRVGNWNEGGLETVLDVDIPQPYSIFIVGQFYHGITSYYYGANGDNSLLMQANTATTGRWLHEINAAVSIIPLGTLQVRGEITAHPSILQHNVGTVNSRGS